MKPSSWAPPDPSMAVGDLALRAKLKFRVPEPIKRALRTFVQAFIGLFLTDLITFLGQIRDWAGCTADCVLPDSTFLRKAAVAAASSASIAVVSLFQNAMEDAGVLPRWGKSDEAAFRRYVEQQQKLAAKEG